MRHLKPSAYVKDQSMKITQSSGNVYADIGVAQPETMLVKARLAQRIGSIVVARKLTQREAAEIIGLSQSKLSNILRGQFRGASEAKLMNYLLCASNVATDNVSDLI